MPSYKLYYFDGRGRAENVRLMFTLAGQSFEDVRVNRDEWAAMKESTPFGSLPMLEIDGKRYAQSFALGAYVAREFGFYGKNTMDALEIEQVAGLVQDLSTAVMKAMFAKDDEKPAAMKNLQEVDVPKFFGFFEKLLAKNGSGYFVGNSITFADVYVYDLLYQINLRMPGCLDKFPAVKKMYDNVANEPKIKAYVAKRKETMF